VADLIVAVGLARGFVIHAAGELVVVTAAHCLPALPSAHRRGQRDGCAYERLLAPLRERPAVGAELLFADPVADIAVLGPLEDRAAYDALVSSVTALRIGTIADARRTRLIKVHLQSLMDEWFECSAIHSCGQLWLRCVGDDKITVGMSGSPILTGGGSVVGVLAVVDGDPERAVYDGGGPGPPPPPSRRSAACRILGSKSSVTSLRRSRCRRAPIPRRP
jgi:hypothetical protein